MGKDCKAFIPHYNRKSLALFVVFFIFSLVLTLFYISSSYQQARQKVEARLSNDSFIVGEWLTGSFKNADYVLRDIVGQVEHFQLSEDHTPAHGPGHHLRHTLLQQKQASLPYAVQAVLFEQDCISTRALSQGEEDFCRELMAQQPEQQARAVSHAYMEEGRVRVAQLRRFNGAEQGFSAMAALVLDQSLFADMIRPLSYGAKGIVAIVDTRMTLLARKPDVPERVGQRVRAPMAQQFIEEVNSPPFIFLQGPSPFDEIERLYVVRKIPDLPFAVAIGVSNCDWQAQWRQQIGLSLVSMLVVQVLGLTALKYHWSANARAEELKKLKLEAEHLARTDMLTGVSSRLDFFERGDHAFSRYLRYGAAFSLVMLDIDYFKRLNDRYGHALGDQVLEALGGVLRVTLRASDIAGRIGGEEFAVILYETPLAEAIKMAERIRTAIEALELRVDQDSVVFTASFGVVEVNSGTDTFKRLLRKADQALYQAKKAGRNRVVSL